MSTLINKDPVYHILKLLQEQGEPHFRQIGMDERDFIVALQHIHEAGYTDRTGNGLSQAGLNYINGYERRTYDSLN
ncbi:hypothetical protein [Paenibacillus typhae]|uniref:YjcQ protein n=1 Tax=Paenibacillus typhae TaxID=1174501 RepID=A0A1G8H6G2_9BACL|nr:hypothetical protein [Paenibacillus typhae]SDI02264.1 hypothetical protein SAMN05216192_102325 [Paenibacillus typhae]